jgi:integrase
MTYPAFYPTSLGDVFLLYSSYVEINDPARAKGILNQTKTALIRYTLPGWGYPKPIGSKLTQKEAEAGILFMNTVQIEQLSSALKVQLKVFEQLNTLKSNQRNYKHHLKGMIDWAIEQNWYASTQIVNFKSEGSIRNPKNSRGLRSTSKELIEKDRLYYALKPSEINNNLQKELDNLYKFLTDEQHPDNQNKAITHVIGVRHINILKRFFGWLYRYKNIPLNSLSFELITPLIHIRYVESRDAARKEAQQAAVKTRTLACEHIKWLREERHVCPDTELKSLSSLIAVCKFLYCNETEYPEALNYSDVPVISLLRREQNKASDRQKNAKPVIETAKTWIEWLKYLEVVEKLRLECSLTSYHDGNKRLSTAIAISYQRYLLAGFLAYMPPDRIRTFAELEIERTLVWKDMKWWIHLMPKDYKTGKTYGEYWGEIPNKKFSDGNCFYDYIKDWLNHWRKQFSPTDNLFFVILRKNKHSKEFTTECRRGTCLSGTLRGSIHRLAGKLTTPHTLRNSFVTYLYERGESDAVMASVAYAMHHSVEAQRGMYDERTQKQKVQLGLNVALEIADSFS